LISEVDIRDWGQVYYETDPDGRSPKEPGSKLDAGKPPLSRGLLNYFPNACLAVADVSRLGAEKYAWKGWETVPDGINRYGDALARHIVYEEIDGLYDPQLGVLHAAEAAWNALAKLELVIRSLK
jgi:hypothetical protein